MYKVKLVEIKQFIYCVSPIYAIHRRPTVDFRRPCEINTLLLFGYTSIYPGPQKPYAPPPSEIVSTKKYIYEDRDEK